MNLKFRPALDGDYESLKPLLDDIQRQHRELRPDVFAEVDCSYTHTEYEKRLHNEDTNIYLAVLGDEIAGYGLTVLTKPSSNRSLVRRRIFVIEELYVRADLRCRGIGKALFRFLELEAKAHRADALELSVWACNPAAVTFYRQMGMVPRVLRMEKRV